MSNPEVVLCSPVRTAIATYGGALKSVPAATAALEVMAGHLTLEALA